MLSLDLGPFISYSLVLRLLSALVDGNQGLVGPGHGGLDNVRGLLPGVLLKHAHDLVDLVLLEVPAALVEGRENLCAAGIPQNPKTPKMM